MRKGLWLCAFSPDLSLPEVGPSPDLPCQAVSREKLLHIIKETGSVAPLSFSLSLSFLGVWELLKAMEGHLLLYGELG